MFILHTCSHRGHINAAAAAAAASAAPCHRHYHHLNMPTPLSSTCPPPSHPHGGQAVTLCCYHCYMYLPSQASVKCWRPTAWRCGTPSWLPGGPPPPCRTKWRSDWLKWRQPSEGHNQVCHGEGVSMCLLFQTHGMEKEFGQTRRKHQRRVERLGGGLGCGSMHI